MPKLSTNCFPLTAGEAEQVIAPLIQPLIRLTTPNTHLLAILTLRAIHVELSAIAGRPDITRLIEQRQRFVGIAHGKIYSFYNSIDQKTNKSESSENLRQATNKCTPALYSISRFCNDAQTIERLLYALLRLGALNKDREARYARRHWL